MALQTKRKGQGLDSTNRGLPKALREPDNRQKAKRKEHKAQERHEIKLSDIFKDPNAAGLSYLYLDCIGSEAYIQHRFGKKVEEQLLRQHMHDDDGEKGPKDPYGYALGCIHYIGKEPKKWKDRDKGIYGIPAAAIKEATVRAAHNIDKVKMVNIKLQFWVECPEDPFHKLIKLETKKSPVMKTDPTRNANGNPDIRCRPYFLEWAFRLVIRFDYRYINPESLYKWVTVAGQYGIGDWRPSRGGINGTFAIADGSLDMPKLGFDKLMARIQSRDKKDEFDMFTAPVSIVGEKEKKKGEKVNAKKKAS